MTTIRNVTIDVDGMEMLTPTGMFLLAANTIYTADYEVTVAQTQNARSVVRGILAAARQARYRKADRLAKLIKTDTSSLMVLTLAQKACDAVPTAEMNSLLLQSHREAVAGAPLYSLHGAQHAFVGAGDVMVVTDRSPDAINEG